MRRIYFFLLSFCLFLPGFNQIQAQQLSINSAVDGSLAVDEEQSFAFTAREGQLLSFIASSETLDAMLRIEDLNANIILSNDDYSYPDSMDAIIEGFVAPYSGSYTLIIDGYGNTSGDYQITMLNGYSTLVLSDDFSSGANWQPVSLDPVNVPTLNVVNDTANLFQSGIDVIGMAVGYEMDNPVYFARGTVDSITDTAGWRAGIVFGYQNERNFYRAVVNHRGAWRLVAISNSEEIVLRDWNVHPAITPDTREFSLAVLVNGNSFDIFYDDQYIGSGRDTNFNNGQIGLVAETINAIGSEVTVRFDDLIVTEPTQVNNAPIFPENIVDNGTNATIRELEQRQLIPAGGEMAFTLSESFAQYNRQGINRFEIGNGRRLSNFAIGTRISRANTVESNACGIVIRDDGAENYVLAYVDNSGGSGISERSGADFIQNAYNLRTDNSSPPYDMVLIVRDEMLHYYLDGIHAASMEIGIREGAIAAAVINFDAVNTNCQFNNLWVWQW